jgi:hypothetical protein
VVGALACACGSSGLAAHQGGVRARHVSIARENAGPAASVGNGAASIAPLATRLFRVDIGNATAAFAAAVVRLQSDLSGGQLPAAKTDELTAQGDYDYFRLLETDDSVNASTLDGTIDNVQPGQTFGGLHAIERDLWVSGDALSDVSGLEPQAQVAEFVLSRLTLPPEAIGTTGVDELNWVNDVAIPGHEELYSHLDAVDISATIAAADQAFDAIQPLAHQVAPSLTMAVAGRFAALESDVAELGAVTDLPDSAISSATRLTLSQQVDATAEGLAQVSATLVPYGTSTAST